MAETEKEIAKAGGALRVLVFTVEHLSGKEAAELSRGRAALDKAGASYVLFDKIMENPVKEVVMEGAACARENGCDFILALGGGAVLDSSKAIAAMATNDGDLWDYVVGGTGKGKPLANKGLPIVTVPTSSGTGSEINCWGVQSPNQGEDRLRRGVPHPRSLRRRPRTHADGAAQIYGVSGL